MYVDEASVMYPPAGGWPDINSEVMHDLKKTDEVISILRHLPYLHSDRGGNAPQIAPVCGLADWRQIAQSLKNGEDPEDVLASTEGYEGKFGGKFPAYCVSLSTGGKYFQPFVLDTREGFVTWMEAPDWVWEVSVPRPGGMGWLFHGGGEKVKDDEGYVSVEEEDDDDDDDNDGEHNESEEDHDHQAGEDDEEDEREENCDESDSDSYDMFGDHPRWTPRDFFTMCENLLRNLDVIPQDSSEIIDFVSLDRSNELREILGPIFWKHGWPDVERYEKEKCLKEVARVIDEGALRS